MVPYYSYFLFKINVDNAFPALFLHIYTQTFPTIVFCFSVQSLSIHFSTEFQNDFNYQTILMMIKAPEILHCYRKKSGNGAKVIFTYLIPFPPRFSSRFYMCFACDFFLLFLHY